MARVFGLLGKKLSHSFSQSYFTEKFRIEGIDDCRYNLYELDQIEGLNGVLRKENNLRGLNVTIPYKQEIIPFLDEIDEKAEKIGAVNVVKIGNDRQFIGYNSDYYGFRSSLEEWIGESEMKQMKALVLGAGGASRAVCTVLQDLGIDCINVSRSNKAGTLLYSDLTSDLIASHRLIINTTPLGMHPNIDGKPDIPYESLTKEHFLHDLVYNPELTKFMQLGMEKGVHVKNGLEMLHKQAEKSWEIWNS